MQLKQGQADDLEHTTGKLQASINKAFRWLEHHDYQAYDPGDGSLSFLRHITFDNHFLNRLLTAAVLRTPFHVRPLLGIQPHTSTKGMGYIAWAYVKMYALTRSDDYRIRAKTCFRWLMTNPSHGYRNYCWGNHFSFSTRAGTIPKDSPTVVWSSLIGLAFLEAYDILRESQYLDVAVSVGEWIKSLPREQTDCGNCISYVPFKQSSIHNSNMLGAALLARVAAYTGDAKAIDIAREGMLYSCSRQNADGAWFYGAASCYHWIDSFHTGYNLDCLKRYIESTGDTEFTPHLHKGFEFFEKTFFTADDRPKYYHNRLYPIDIQCAAQAVDTLCYFADSKEHALKQALRVAEWTIDNMQSADGHFYYRDLGWTKARAPMLHWGQGTMCKALAHLLATVRPTGGSARANHDAVMLHFVG